ncbi:GNAT family N-acetyltransferase [Nocardia pseudovaccinii]|uniref:GNAT family N-acetyltransferase n=1 Tax=Nocardia pseudovaccinii TaxID=189540 RepID=UPI0007A47384|nr:GNAT family N-acetyltransferase [Nocardia pseudovaccinii]
MPTEFAPGLFAGQDLAARVEHAERTLIEEGACAAARRDPQQRVLVRPIGGGLAVWAGPGSPLDKVVGIGMNGTAFDDAELDAVEQAFAEREAPVQVEVSTLADPAVVERLTRRGYVLFGFENVLGLRLEPGRQAQLAESIEIRDVGHDAFETWVNVVVDGFATPDTQGVASHEEFPREAIERAERDLTATSGFVGSLAMIDGKPAGGASLRLSDGVAQLCGAATLPEFRRRGVQGALLSMRLAAAAAAGCDLAVVTTLPGSKSQQNVQKLGFQLLYPRAVLVR